MSSLSSRSRGGVRRCLGAGVAIPLLLSGTSVVGADDEAPLAARVTATTGGAPCSRGHLDCADGRIATRWDLDTLARDLPSGRSLWSLLETAEAAAITDRIEGAGLYPDQPARFAMRGTSWTQNVVVIDGVDVTDPLHGGTPLVLPDVDGLLSIEATPALASAEYPAPGVTLELASRTPAESWRGTVQAYGLGSGLQSKAEAGDAAAVARFGSLLDGSVLVRGPASERLGLLAAARVARVRRFERADTGEREARLATGRLQLAYRAGAGDTLRLGALGQWLDRPFAATARFGGAPVSERADAFAATSAWSHDGNRTTASAYAGFATGHFVPQTEGRVADATVERLRDGPVPGLVFPSQSRRSSWSVGGRLAFRASDLGGLEHAPRVGVTVARAWVTESAGLDGPVPETVDGLAARVWDYSWPGSDSRRHRLELSAWASERLAWRDRLLVEAGLRLQRTTGAAEGATQGVSWTSLLPRVSARLRLTGAGRLSLVGGWAEYRHRLLLDALAFGDPSGPIASVYRWTDADGNGVYDASERGALVTRAGPGAGDGSLSTIDPGLRPPRTRELVAGLEASPGTWLLALFGFDRRETDLVQPLDVGVTADDYVVRYLPDPSGDIVGPQDDQLLPVFDRRPESFGRDRYVLANAPDDTGLHQGVELRVEKRLGARFGLFLGATASRTEVRGASRGFRATENDQGVIGELYVDPNAQTYSLGRGFFDRAYTIKVAGAWRGPHDLRLGFVARYQDGQPFGRLVVVPGLAQGPEAVPATPRGQSFGRAATVDPQGRPLTADGHRFTYTLTVDARAEKGFRFGPRRGAFVVEAFNLLGLHNEVEEDPVWGPRFRETTAIQPPRVIRLGARFDF